MGDVAKIEIDKKRANGARVPGTGGVEVVELLVPGLGPVDRDRMLRPRGRGRETGDDKAGFYRSADRDPGVVPGTEDQLLVREIYDWTRLTIGGASRALWLFLMPFLLINLVAWMQPRWPSRVDGRGTKLAGAVYEFAARLLALSLTVLVVGTFGQVAMDQFAWQCHPAVEKRVCGDQAGEALAGLPGPQWGLALAALVPAGVAFVLLRVARDAKQEYLPVLPTVTADEAEAARRRRDADGLPLELAGFWEHNRREPGIAAQHVWAGLLTTAALLTWTPMHQDPAGSTAKTIGIALFAVISAMALVVVVSVPALYRKFGIRLPEHSLRARLVARTWYLSTKPIKIERETGTMTLLPLWPTRYPLPAGICCAVVNAAALLYCLWPDRQWRVEGQLPGIQVQSTALLLAQGVGVALLLISAVLLPCKGTRRGMALFGHAGAAVAVLACFLGWLYTVALAQWTSAWLAEDRAGPVVTEPVHRMGMILLPVLVTVALAAAVMWVVVRLLPVPAPDVPRPAHPDRSDADLTKDDQRHLNLLTAARRRHTYLLRELNWLIGFSALAIVVWIVLFDQLKGLRKPEEGARSLIYDLLGAASVPLLAALAALMLFAFRTLALRPEMRQNAGLAWAFGAFWPRAVHPFAPPSWTTRAVPELVRRLQFLLRDEHRLVLIRASSMGSVLALAAIWQLEARERERIGLLTSGCPVGMYFSRQYPGFVCGESIRWLAPCGARAKLGAWTNVWRDTDPLGGPVGIECVDRQWPDDAEDWQGVRGVMARRSERHPVFPPINGHRNYTTDDLMIRERDRVLERLLRVRAAGDVIAPPTASP
ncbi:hypothetical protein ABT121_05180 [Streptomyces sp. NPDC001928]|uniref:hypothetical protein n=1 Tax=Streptomyces sp. NPDC001928 TaxID=3154404 RepID=UPI00332FB375